MKLTIYKLFRNSAIAAALLMTLSCDKILNLAPQDAVSVPTYFKNETDMELYSNQFYPNVFPGGDGIIKEVGDNMIWTPLAEEVSCTRIVPQNGGGWNFTTLRKINFLLEHVDNCPDKAVVRKYTGVARFFRAVWYSNMMKRFGEVPWIDHVLSSNDPDLMRPRDSRDFLMDKILEDIDYSIEVFKKDNSQKSAYRVTWYTAQAYKSRICLFEGTFRKYHGLEGWEKYLQEAVSAGEALMQKSNTYGLYTSGNQPYRDLFTSEDAKTAEVILARDYDRTASLSNGVLNTVNTPGQGRVGFTRRFVNLYLCSDGSRFTDKPGWKTMEFVDEVVGRDPRLAQTIRTSNGLNFTNCITGYQPLKYVSDADLNSTAQSFNDLPLMRMAEVYLNVAEAKAELGTLTQDDLDKTVNKIRSRAKMPPLYMDWANANPDPYLDNEATGYVNVSGVNKGVILEIRRERTIELVMESQNRYWDLIRWKEGHCINSDFEGIYIPASQMGKAYDVNGDSKPDICAYIGGKPSISDNVSFYDVGKDYKVSEETYGRLLFFQGAGTKREWNEDRDYFYPIPRDEINLTNGAITQNNGWN